MTLIICSQQEVISDFVQHHLRNNAKASELSSLVLRDSLSDLVQVLMRKVAIAETEKKFQGPDLLDSSIDKALADLSQSTRTNNIHLLRNYFATIRKRLKYTAQEIAELQSKYQETSENSETNFKRIFEPDSSTKFNVTALGIDEVKGFWASPILSDQTIQIDLDYLQNVGQVKGDWFPLEVAIGELNFVIDDDGSVYVSTENFPERLIRSSYKETTRVLP